MKKITPTIPIYPSSKDPTSVFSIKTSASCECANDKAQRRRYEAVFEIQPSTN